jgi:hypothetical protein
MSGLVLHGRTNVQDDDVAVAQPPGELVPADLLNAVGRAEIRTRKVLDVGDVRARHVAHRTPQVSYSRRLTTR